MARKDPFKRIAVSDRIYDALDAKRLEESKDDFRPLPMNAYCEKILWDFATGKLIRLSEGSSKSAREFRVADAALALQPETKTEENPHQQQEKRRRHHGA